MRTEHHASWPDPKLMTGRFGANSVSAWSNGDMTILAPGAAVHTLASDRGPGCPLRVFLAIETELLWFMTSPSWRISTNRRR
ncbi:hypothetical protein ABIE85_003910 [Bradyrhizobium diazoefficiens]